jgi:hypothetical protein
VLIQRKAGLSLTPYWSAVTSVVICTMPIELVGAGLVSDERALRLARRTLEYLRFQ